jgi:CHAT domain-containing protein
VLISTDGALAKLPFGALPGEAPGSCLLEEKSIAVIPAPQTLVTWAREEQDAAKAGRMLIVAGVNYDSRNSSAPVGPQVPETSGSRAPLAEGALFSPLPGTARELEAISQKFRENHGERDLMVVRDAAASADRVVSEAPNYSYLHFATHGYFAAPSFKSAMEVSVQQWKAGDLGLASDQSLAGYHPGLLSGLALAGANKPDGNDDGILTAEEVGTLNLNGAELAVLSACETGLGSPAGGEGLLGLQRAFQKAGAKTVVASLWSVPDEATKMLMVRFYENLWQKKLGKLEALREAQLWMLKEGAGQEGMRRELAARGLVAAEGTGDREPGTGNRLPVYYWGAWVLSGDWR